MPKSFQCSPDDPVKWKHVQGLMADVKATAKELNYQTYLSPADKSDSVWMETDTPAELDLALHFDLDANRKITGVKLVEGFKTQTLWQPEPYMDKLIEEKSLLAILKEDDCICTLMWLIKKSSAGHTFDIVSQLPTGCCPTLAVPKEGDSALGNPIIPSAVGGFAGEATNGWREVPACRKGGTAAVLYSKGKATAVQRAFRVKLTWAIRKKHFDEVYKEWLKLVELAPSIRGKQLKPSITFASVVSGLGLCGSLVGPFTPGNSSCVLAKILQSWKQSEFDELEIEGLDFNSDWGSKPGCVELEQPTGFSALKKPWLKETCGAEDCEDKQRVYCNTLLWLNNVARILRGVLCPSADKSLDWEKDFFVSQGATDCQRVSFNVNKSADGMTISVEMEAYGTCGGPTGCLGMTASVSIYPLCGRHKFNITASGEANNVAGSGPECDDTQRANVVTVTSSGRVFKAGVKLDKCIEDPENSEEVEAAICSSTGSIEPDEDTPTESGYVTFSSGLSVSISLSGLQSMSVTVTIDRIKT